MRLNSSLSLSALALTLVAATPALAADAVPGQLDATVADPATGDPAAGDPTDLAESDDLTRHGSEILVVATRVRGQVEAPQAPIATLGEADIAALGASSLADVLAQLSPQTGSGRGRGGGQPVVLVNGQRISSFREMRNYPPEAIRKVEVLPEEVALRFGFPADARVVNIILKDDFQSRVVEAEYGMPDRGGSHTAEVEATLLRINGPNRLSLTANIEDTGPLTEAERPLVQGAGNRPDVTGDPDPAAFRTLIADSREMSLNAAWTRGLGAGGKAAQLSLNGTVTRSDTRSLSGLDMVTLVAPDGTSARRALADPLERTTRTTTLQGGAGLNLPLGAWQLSATLDGSHTEVRSVIDRRADTAPLVAAAAAGTLPVQGPLPGVAAAGADRASSNSDGATALVTLVGRPLRLPAGEISLTAKGGFAYSSIESADTRSAAGITSLRRGDASAGLNIGIPLASRRENSLAALGDVTLNFSAGYNHLSDFGDLKDWSAGITWSPLEGLGLQASYLVNEAAPSLTELGNPTTLTFNVPVYDFPRGETVLVTITGGGNPSLRKERQRDLKLSANWQLPFLGNSSLLVEYFRNRSNDVTAAFPLLTPAIEAAFPGRATRAADGTLLAIDRRPVTLSEQTGSRLRWGLNLGGTIGKASPGGGGPLAGLGGRGAGGSRSGGPPPGGMRGPGGGGGGRGMMGALMGGGGQGRWNFGVYHTVQFASEVLVVPGGPVLDLLGGDALSGGGTARHALEFNGGAFHKGFGMFVQGNWSAPTRIRASGAPGTSDLRFGAVAKLNLNLFADLGQQARLVRQAPFLKGSRLSLRFQNVLDSRQKVTDASGAVPLSYQPDYLDPTGRFIELEFRKTF